MTQRTTFQIPYYPVNLHKDVIYGLLQMKGIDDVDYKKVVKHGSAMDFKMIEITVKFNDKIIDSVVIDDYVRKSLRRLWFSLRTM